MPTTYHNSINNFELSLKLNVTSAFSLPSFGKSILTASNKRFQHNSFYFLPILYTLILNFGSVPTLTYIRKPSAGFRTKKNELHGLAFQLNRSQTPLFFEAFFMNSIHLASELGYFKNLGFGFSGNLQLGFPSITIFPFTKSAHLSQFYTSHGFDFNVFFQGSNTSLTSSASLKRSVIFFSNFNYFNPKTIN